MREFWVAAGLLWLAGGGLRLSILAVPPGILLIQADLRLSAAELRLRSRLSLWPAAHPVRDRGAAGIALDRALRRFGDARQRPLDCGRRLRSARRRARCARVLCRHRCDERRHRHHAAGAATARPPMAAAT